MEILLVNIILGLVSVGAFTLAIYQTHLAIKQQNEAKKLTQDLEDIRLSLSTQYLGAFPEYIPQTIKLISQAKKEILIACSIPGYGLFSSRNTWFDYETTIKKKLGDNIPIDFIYSSADIRNDLQEEQFKEEIALWKNGKLPKKFKVNLENFMGYYAPQIPLKDLSSNTFLETLEKQQQIELKSVFRGAQTLEIKIPFVIHYWIVDEDSAVFTITSFANYVPEVGFYTSDEKIIKALKCMHERYKNRFSSKD